MRVNRKFAIVTAVVALAVTMTACSSGDDAGTSPTASGSLSAAAEDALARAYQGWGSDLAALEATTPAAGTNFFVMSCGESNVTCHAPAQAMVDAATAAGWNANIVDGKLSPDGFAAAIRQAVAAGANVIVPVGISCSAAQAAFQEAKNAGIVIVGGGGQDDCSPKLWDSERLWLPTADQPTKTGMFGAFGTAQADYVYGRTNGDPKAVVINMTSQGWGQLITDAFTAQLKTLGGGEVLATVDISDPESADGSFIQKVTSALLANPDANALIVPTDAYLVNGLAAAINQAGLADKLTVVGNFGSAAALDMIRSGQPGITATIGDAQDWEAWGSVDTAIRMMNKQDAAYIGQTVQAVDADHNMPASGAYNGAIDWKSKFLSAWGK